MEPTAHRLRRQQQISDWLKPHLRWITLPSWLMSAAFHVALVAVLIVVSQLPSCRADIQGEDGDGFRTVGIYVREPALQPRPETPAPRDQLQPESAQTTTAEPVPQDPPVPLTLPAASAPPVLGAGPLADVGSGPVEGLLKPHAGPQRATGSAAGGESGTTLFGIGDDGKRFVYVIDRSLSMRSFGAFRVAKAELMASIERLNGHQEFQIIFYNHAPYVLRPGNGRFDVFWGTDTQRLDAISQINMMQEDGGTEHMPALRKALEFNPDVIFFLTDGDHPSLSRPELDEIRRRNRRARIHCIQFGDGTQITDPIGRDPGNWVQKLAAQNDGKYTYRDVRRFQERP